MLHAGFAQHAAEAPDLGFAPRQAGLVVGHATEELPHHVLVLALDQLLVAQVERVLQVHQRDYQPDRQTRPAGVAVPGASQLCGQAEQVGTIDHPVTPIIVREGRCQRTFDLGPRHQRH